MIVRRYGKPKADTFPYLVDTLMNQYIVYAISISAALKLYKRSHSYDPWSIRQMSDNE